MTAQTDIDWVHPFRSEQVSLYPGGTCYRCGGDKTDQGKACRDCSWMPVPDVTATWGDNALCAEVDPELFFHTDGERPATSKARDDAAKAVCARCPVRAECLTYALTIRAADGVWGGMTAPERVNLRRRERERGAS